MASPKSRTKPAKKKPPKQAREKASKKPAKKAPARHKAAAISQRVAEQRLAAILEEARALTALRRLGPRTPAWEVGLELVGSAAMQKVNRQYRNKDYATDVLSFTPPEIFFHQGYLGELVICLPVLMRQSREQKHAARDELDVLLVHGVLHLLGFDHEQGPKEAAQMARWEKKLLPRVAGLIDRAG